MGKAGPVKQRTQTHNKRKRLMGNVHNSVNNDSVSESVNIELPTKIQMLLTALVFLNQLLKTLLICQLHLLKLKT